MPGLRVFVVDDHEVVRLGISDLLNGDDCLTVVGEASTVAQTLARIPALHPDVAVLDVRLPDGAASNCAGAAVQVAGAAVPDAHLVPRGKAMMDAFLAGAGGYVIKDITGVDLVTAVRTVGPGRSLLDHAGCGRVDWPDAARPRPVRCPS